MDENRSIEISEKVVKTIGGAILGVFMGVFMGVFIVIVGTTIFSGSNVFEWDFSGPIGAIFGIAFMGVILGCGFIGAIIGAVGGVVSWWSWEKILGITKRILRNLFRWDK